MAPDGRKWRVHDGIADAPDCPGILAAAQPAAECPNFLLHLPPELLHLVAHGGWPSVIAEVLATMEQEHTRLIRAFSHPVRHVQGRGKAALPRPWRCQALEEGSLKSRGGAQPHLPEQDVARVEPVIDRARRCAHGARNSANGGPGRPVPGDEPTGSGQDLRFVEPRPSRHQVLEYSF